MRDGEAGSHPRVDLNAEGSLDPLHRPGADAQQRRYLPDAMLAGRQSLTDSVFLRRGDRGPAAQRQGEVGRHAQRRAATPAPPTLKKSGQLAHLRSKNEKKKTNESERNEMARKLDQERRKFTGAAFAAGKSEGSAKNRTSSRVADPQNYRRFFLKLLMPASISLRAFFGPTSVLALNLRSRSLL